MNSSRFCILGGSFDPVHDGHLAIARKVLEDLEYESVLFVPASIAPHKNPTSTSAEDRLAMLELAIRDIAAFAVDRYEIEKGGVSFTVDTLRHFHDTRSIDGKPGLLIGTDLVEDFESWKEPDEIERLADLIVVERPGTQDVKFERSHRRILDIHHIESSAQIRSLIGSGRDYGHLVPEAVVSYIEANRLYR